MPLIVFFFFLNPDFIVKIWKGSSDGKKNLPAVQETLVHSLGQEDPLEKGMATHSRIVA